MNVIKRALPVLALLAALPACGTPDVTADPVFVSLGEENEALVAETEALQADVAQLEGRLETLASENASLASERDAAAAEVEALLLKYDEEIRAELQAAYEAEVVRACEVAKAEVSRAIGTITEYDEAWEPVASRVQLANAVESCAAAERAKSEAEREAERLAGCKTVDVDAVVKAPEAHRGSCYVMYARIWQFDSRTGTCSFMADVSDRSHHYGFDYGEGALFTSVSAYSCPQLDGIDEDDHVKVWATGSGAYRYDTAMGGTNELPRWTIEKIVLVRKD